MCRYVLATIFLLAALTKITDLNAFCDRVLLHSGIPRSLGLVVAAVLPWLELTCGFCLFFKWAVREAALILAMLLVVFLIHSLLSPTAPDCGCLLFPQALQPANHWPWLPLRNFVLLLGSAWLAWRK